MIDIFGLGCTAVDDVIYVAAYPAADMKARVLRRERHCGGLTATALVAAARLGARCAFGGVLGPDEASRFVLGHLAREGVDVSHATSRREARPIQSLIVVDEARRTRNIFFDIENVFGAPPRSPSRKQIEGCKVLFVDNFGIQGMTRAATIARSAGIPVVADFESSDGDGFQELLSLVDHLILSESFALKLTGAANPAAAARSLWNPRRAVVVITSGERGCLFVDSSRHPPRRVPAFSVKALDTTGCGDVFHGAYAAALAHGTPLQERLRFASAAAALKATRHGGQQGIPTLTVVNQFLQKNS